MPPAPPEVVSIPLSWPVRPQSRRKTQFYQDSLKPSSMTTDPAGIQGGRAPRRVRMQGGRAPRREAYEQYAALTRGEAQRRRRALIGARRRTGARRGRRRRRRRRRSRARRRCRRPGPCRARPAPDPPGKRVVAAAETLLQRGEERRRAEEDPGVEGVVVGECLADVADRAALDPDLGHVVEVGGRVAVDARVDREDHLVVADRLGQQTRENPRVEKVVRHQQHEAPARGSRRRTPRRSRSPAPSRGCARSARRGRASSGDAGTKPSICPAR